MFKLRIPVLLTVIALMTAGSRPMTAQTVNTIDPALKERIDAIAAGVMQQRGVPSASIAVVQGGKLVYTHAYGRRISIPAKPATPDMRYSIGSVSKQFTAAAILLLQEQGKLSLDDAVGKYRARADERRRGDDPADSLAYIGLSGLLARRLPDDADDEAGERRSRSSTHGRKSLSTSSRARSGNTRTPTT